MIRRPYLWPQLSPRLGWLARPYNRSMGMRQTVNNPVRSNQSVEFLRVVQQHHIQLSSMADFKANVLLGASFLILTASLKEVHDGRLSAGLVVIMLTVVTAACLVLLAMLPSTSKGNDVQPNLLFFGVFAQMPESEFETQMLALLSDEDQLNRAMIRDIHQLGSVLALKKYKRLGQAYRTFFFGLCFSAALLVVEWGWAWCHRH